MSRKILFVGAGAIGSYLGAFLSRAGHDVTLVDPWAEQVETIRQKGQELEADTLYEAVKMYLENKLEVYWGRVHVADGGKGTETR